MEIMGDIGPVFDALKKLLVVMGFTESSLTWPTNMELRRGKGGLFVTNIKDCKTVLKVSLKQAHDNVDILFDYNIELRGMFTDKDNQDIQAELMKIKHALVDVAPSPAPKTPRVCEVCFTPLKVEDVFCPNCGRSTDKQKVTVSPPQQSKLEVSFDPTKVQFGQKGVDDILYGGIPNNSAIVITSPPCEEEDLLITRFIETGLDQSEIVVYSSVDNSMMKNQKAIENKAFYQLICNPQADLMVPEGIKNVTKVKGIEHLTELSVALTTLLNNISLTENKPRRLVLNILSDMLLSCHSVNTRKWLSETIAKFKTKNFTILAKLNPHMHSKEEASAVLDLFDGQIDIYEKEHEGSFKRYLRVKRMSNTQYSSKEVELVREDLLIQK